MRQEAWTGCRLLLARLLQGLARGRAGMLRCAVTSSTVVLCIVLLVTLLLLQDCTAALCNEVLCCAVSCCVLLPCRIARPRWGPRCAACGPTARAASSAETWPR